MACRSTNPYTSASGKSAECPCFPSCQLFPRRSDGKVVLPNPVQIPKEDPITQISRSTSQMRLDVKRRINTVPETIYIPKHPSVEGNGSRRPTDGGGKLEWRPPKNSAGLTSPTTKSVDNYAQLSSLPEFKAFKLNQEGQPQDRETASPGLSVSKGTLEPQEWMREVKVSRRTKKQTYVRSESHDFCIRLYTGQNED